MAHRSFRRAAALVATLTVGTMLGACSEQSSPLAPTAPAAAPVATTTATPNALLGLPIGGIVGGLLNLVGSIVAGVVNGLPLPHPLPSTSYSLLKLDPLGMHAAVKHGLSSVPSLSCTGQAPAPQTRLIGPAGGTLTIGAHRLDIPAGALNSTVAITASVPTGTTLGIQFAPHGLQFNKPVEITLDYGACTVPNGSYLNVVYSDSTGSNVVLDGMPSTNVSSTHKITALTDHFSGYIVAWGVN